VQTGVQRLVGEILRSAREEADGIVERAMSEAQDSVEASRREAESEYKDVLERARANLELERQRVISEAVLRSQSLLLDAKEKLINSVFEESLVRIRSFTSSPEYAEVLERLAGEALRVAGSSDVELLVNEPDAKKLSRLLSKGAGEALSRGLSSTRMNVIGGVVARSSSGKIEVDNTIDGRFSRAKDALRTEVSRILFSGGSV